MDEFYMTYEIIDNNNLENLKRKNAELELILKKIDKKLMNYLMKEMN